MGVGVCAQMLHAVAYLHAQNVWHRDLKSSNVLMAHQYGQRIIKVRTCLRGAQELDHHTIEECSLQVNGLRRLQTR